MHHTLKISTLTGKVKPFTTPGALFTGGFAGGWWEAMDVSGTGNLTDLSGNSLTLAQATAANRPSFANSLLTFDGTNDAERSTTAVSGNQITMVVAADPTDAVATAIVMATTVASADRVFLNLNTDVARAAFYNGSVHVQATGTPPAGMAVYTAEFTKGSSVGLRINGQTQTGTDTPQGSANNVGTCIGANSGGGAGFYTGTFRGGLLINRRLSFLERAGIEAYFANLAGVTF